MLFRIKFISDEVEGFIREVLIDSEATFLQLNDIVLKSCNYPDDQMTSFYICNEEWERGMQITREDMGTTNVDEDVLIMGKTRLSEFLEDEGQNLQFVFDPFSDRVFYMTVKEAVLGKQQSEAEIVRSVGKPPRQIEELDFSLPTGNGDFSVEDADEDDIFAGEGGFNDDELDIDGFEISDSSELL